jgi:DNA polymerase-3 subunit beta
VEEAREGERGMKKPTKKPPTPAVITGTVKGSALLAEMEFARPLAETRSTIPHLLLDIQQERIEVVGTNLDVTARGVCAATASGACRIAVPSKLATSLLRGCVRRGAHEVSFAADLGEGTLTLSSGMFESRVDVLPGSDFPTLPARPESFGATIAAAGFREAARHVAISISRFQLHGALMEIEPGAARLVSTDGHRMTVHSFAAETRARMTRRVFVPLAALNGSLDGEEMGYAVAGKDLISHLSGENRLLSFRTADINFPDYRQVIPKHEHRAVVGAQAMRALLGHIMPMTNPRIRACVLYADQSNQATLTISVVNNIEGVSGKATIPITYDGPSAAMAFNAEYLLQFFESVEGEVAMSFDPGARAGDGNSAMMLSPIATNGACTYIVMPMNLDPLPARHAKPTVAA